MMKGAERRMEKERKDCPLKRSAEVKRLFERIEKLKKEKAVVILGIDGMCGSGKTTLARLIEDNFQDVVIVHMDDFFLPPELRSPERYAEPGGNVHYERFREEVFAPLMNGEQRISYRRFSCHEMAYLKEPVTAGLREGSIVVIEGSYSLRPDLRDAYDIRVFTCCDEAVQLARIEERNGKERLRDFREKWIPLENRYFESCHPRETADMVVDTSESAS